MAAKKTATKKMSSGAKAGIGIGLTAAVLGAAAAYFLVGSKNAAQNRKKVKGWTLKAKGEVLEALEKAEEITSEEYHELVDAATKAYGTVKEASQGEIKDFKKEMMEHWNKLEKNKAVKKVAQAFSPEAQKKQAPKKTARKATSKKASA